MTDNPSTVCPDCGHTAAMHHPTLTRGDGCIGRFNSDDMATLGEIRAGQHCACPLQLDELEDTFP